MTYRTKLVETLSGTTLITELGGLSLPLTISLGSTSGSRLIELSTDMGITYFTIAAESDTTAAVVVTAVAPITHVKVTGVTGDTLTILG